MTDSKKSIEERLAALKGETVETHSAGISAADAALARIAASQDADREREASREAAASEASMNIPQQASRLLKGDEKNNIKNLYGLVGVFAAAGRPLAGPAQFAAKWSGLSWTFNKAKDAWDNYGGPVRWMGGIVNNTVVKPAVWWTKINWELYKKAAVSYEDDGTKKNHYARGAASIAFSLAATAAIAGAVVPVANIAYDTAMYAATNKTETLWMTGTDLVDEDEGVYTAGGCKELPCSEANSIYFKIRPSLFLEGKTLMESGGRNWWQPETQIAAIPEVTSRCTVEYAGIRFKPLKWYPYILETQCSHRMEQAQPDMPTPAAQARAAYHADRNAVNPPVIRIAAPSPAAA